MENQQVDGVLRATTFSTPAYKLTEKAYLLQLDKPACLEGKDAYDQVENAPRVHLFFADTALEKKLKALLGRKITARGTPFGEYNAHHHAPIVLQTTGIDVPPR